MAADHAGLIFELANLVRDGLQGDQEAPTSARGARGVTSTMRISSSWRRARR